ncbi:MAG: hypothetical protein ACSW79_02035 [Eubacteriales bacterium]
MATIKRCDRCGRIYDLPEPGELSGFSWTSDDLTICKTFDLCPECVDSLSDWLENREEPQAEEHPAAPAPIPYEKPVIGGSLEEVQSPKKRTKHSSETKEAVVRDLLRGEKQSAVVEKYGLANKKQASNIYTVFKNANPDRFAELEAEVRKEAKPQPDSPEPVNP